MLKGQQSWVFDNRPMITATGVTGGPFEANGNLANDFDLLYDDLWMGQESYEKAHRLLLEEAIKTALEKGNIQKEQVQFLFAGDLINQITPTSFAARTMQIPYFGLFGILIAFGHSVLAMSGEETLAQVNREIAHPKKRSCVRPGECSSIHSARYYLAPEIRNVNI